MDLTYLMHQLELPAEVIGKMNEYGNTRTAVITDALTAKLQTRETWNEFLTELRAAVGEDPDGIGILWEMLDIAAKISYPRYAAMNIPDTVWTATMKFCTRVFSDNIPVFGKYRFDRDWWFPRELALLEFRIGALEYEYVNEPGNRYISVHIPSDADFSPESVDASLQAFDRFRDSHFPEWNGLPFKCISWMMVPELKQLLDSDSNILRFQQRFDIENVDSESRGFLYWVFPGFHGEYRDLPERTSLQRRMKQYLLNGGKLGFATGVMKQHP